MFAVECGSCGTEFESKRRSARYCSDRCRKRGNRAGVKPDDDSQSTPDTSSPEPRLVAETRKRLAELSKVDTVMGQQVLEVARRMCSPTESGSAVAALSREHSRLMVLLARDAREVDPVQAAKDEVARKRAQRNAG